MQFTHTNESDKPTPSITDATADLTKSPAMGVTVSGSAKSHSYVGEKDPKDSELDTILSVTRKELLHAIQEFKKAHAEVKDKKENEEQTEAIFLEFFNTNNIESFIYSIDDVISLLDVYPDFAHFICLRMETVLIKSMEDLEKVLKKDKSLWIKLFKDEEAAKKYVTDANIHQLLEIFDPDTPAGSIIARSKEVAIAINTAQEYFLLTETNSKMAAALLAYHPSIVIMLLKLPYLKEEITASLLPHVIQHNIFEDPTLFLEVAKNNWKIAKKLIENPEIAERVKDVLPLASFAWLIHRHGFDKKETKNHHLRSLKALDLDIKQAIVKEPDKDFKKILIAEKFFLYSDFFWEIMFGKTGYYSTDKIKFSRGDDKIRGDYLTLPSMFTTRTTFAAKMLYQLVFFRKEMIGIGSLKKDALFTVLECGAGDGDLCRNIFEIAKKLKNRYPSSEWSDFFDHLHYTILEISPALLDRQKKQTEPFHEKMTFVHGSAVHLHKYFKNKSIAALISNELVDMFRQDVVFRDKSDVLKAAFVIPTIHEKNYLLYFHKFLDERFLASLKAESEKYKEYIKSIFDGSPKDAAILRENILLSKNNFLTLHQYYVADKKFAPQKNIEDDLKVFEFINLPMEVFYFPKLDQFVKQFPETTLRDTDNLICTDILKFMVGASQVLIDNGYVLTVDYGDSESQYVNFIRTYYQGKTGYQPFRTPGFIDLTGDVNFTNLVEVGENQGFSLVEYDLLRDTLNQHFIDLFKNSNILDDEAINFFAKNISSFKICIQKKSLEVKPRHAPSLPLTRAEEIDFSKRKEEFRLFSKISQNKPPKIDAPFKQQEQKEASNWKIFTLDQYFELLEYIDSEAKKAMQDRLFDVDTVDQIFDDLVIKLQAIKLHDAKDFHRGYEIMLDDANAELLEMHLKTPLSSKPKLF